MRCGCKVRLLAAEPRYLGCYGTVAVGVRRLIEILAEKDRGDMSVSTACQIMV